MVRTLLGLTADRYLTKLADQVLALISDEHADMLRLGDESSIVIPEVEDDSDRMFACRVTKTQEQQETVTTTPGFEVSIVPIYLHDSH